MNSPFLAALENPFTAFSISFRNSDMLFISVNIRIDRYIEGGRLFGYRVSFGVIDRYCPATQVVERKIYLAENLFVGKCSDRNYFCTLPNNHENPTTVELSFLESGWLQVGHCKQQI